MPAQIPVQSYACGLPAEIWTRVIKNEVFLRSYVISTLKLQQLGVADALEIRAVNRSFRALVDSLDDQLPKATDIIENIDIHLMV